MFERHGRSGARNIWHALVRWHISVSVVGAQARRRLHGPACANFTRAKSRGGCVCRPYRNKDDGPEAITTRRLAGSTPEDNRVLNRDGQRPASRAGIAGEPSEVAVKQNLVRQPTLRNHAGRRCRFRNLARLSRGYAHHPRRCGAGALMVTVGALERPVARSWLPTRLRAKVRATAPPATTRAASAMRLRSTPEPSGQERLHGPVCGNVARAQ